MRLPAAGWMQANFAMSHFELRDPLWLLALVAPAAIVSIVGGFAWEYIWVEAGQSVPNS